MKFEGINQEYIEIVDIDSNNAELITHSRQSELSLVWFTSDDNKLTIDTVDYSFNTNDLVSLTEFHKVEINQIKQARLIRWNRSFYCIVDHDSEVGCKGILYYGASRVPVIQPGLHELEVLETVMKMFLIEMNSKDNLQREMLQMMLKRLLILCTRVYKQHDQFEQMPKYNDIIREYNFLVEQHFRTKHSVQEYAELLHKSPKTLSNLFRKHGKISPLQFIQNRIMLEARRLLTYTDASVSEIGYELGFSDVQVFSRFFKKYEGCSPQFFREREELTTA